MYVAVSWGEAATMGEVRRARARASARFFQTRFFFEAGALAGVDDIDVLFFTISQLGGGDSRS